MKRWMSRVMGVMSVLAVGVVIGGAAWPTLRGAAFDEAYQNEYQITGELIAEMERTFSEIYNRAAPGVVSIISSADEADQFGVSTGSGFVLDLEGHIATNYHVVEGASRMR